MDRSPVSRRRRDLLKGAGAATALSTLGFPAIVRGQSDAIRFGHLTPRTGFLGPLGEYAVMGVTLAVEEINAAGGVMGRKIELIAEDSVNPQTASTKAERLIERDKVAVHHRRDQLGVRARDRAGRAAQPHAVLQHGLQLGRAPRQGVQSLHVPHRGREQHVRRRRRPGAAARRHGQGQEVVQPHRRLRVRSRPPQGREALHGGERRHVRRRRARADGCRRLLAVPAQDPQREARSRRVEPRRRADHQLHEAVHGIRPAVPGRRVRLRHRRRMGRGQGQRARHLAARLGFAGADAVVEALHRRVREEIRQAAGEPGVGRLHVDEARRAGDERDQVDRFDEDRRAPRKGREVRHHEDARRLLPQLGPPADAGDVHDHVQAGGRGQGQVGPLHGVGAGSRGATRAWK